MKLSNISIIFIIIVIPIILVLSYYISLQIDTINMQTSYSTKQLDATKEAIEAFEINTVEWNEAYSTTSDSKRRDVMASINTFTTNFANSLGIGGTNKENILAYVPAIACTLYDGYYIYSPTDIKEVIKDENGVAVVMTEEISEKNISRYRYTETDEGKLLYKVADGKSQSGTYNGTPFTLDSDNAKSTYSHILKPFSKYSARYRTNDGDTDITVNYTLDNYISIYGKVDGNYIVKSGYLINTSSDYLETETLKEKIAWRWNEDGSYTCQEYTYVYAEDNTKVYFDVNTAFQVSSTGKRTNLDNTTDIKYKKIKFDDGTITYQALNGGDIKIKNLTGDAVTVRIEQGMCYSDKRGTVAVDTRIGEGDLKKDYSAHNYYVESEKFTKWVTNNLQDIIVDNMQDVDDKLLYGNSNDRIFKIGENNDPENEDSIFVKHKREVIKQSLISNLNQAITSYSRNSDKEFKLPILTETDWDYIYRNVSIITFVQGLPIGAKYYNNYTVATSTNNREYVNPDEIYLSDISEGNVDEYYHMPYCEKLTGNNIIGYRNIDYVVKSYKEGDETKYYYKHSNIANQSCYYCLIQRDLYNENITDKKTIAYKTALARERYNNKSFKTIVERPDYVPDDALYNEETGHWYKAYTFEEADTDIKKLYGIRYGNYNRWDTAKKMCEKLEGHLVTINSESEQRFIETELDSVRFWIGAYRKTTGDGKTWYWTEKNGDVAFCKLLSPGNTQADEGVFMKWGTGQPDSNTGNQRFGIIDNQGAPKWGIKKGDWDDVTVNQDITVNPISHFICEWE